MKIYWIWKLILIMIGFGSVFGFTSYRNNHRKIEKIEIDFSEEKFLMITSKTVRNMLIEKVGKLTEKQKNQISLGQLEKVLSSNGIIERANASFSLGGQLRISIKQRTPVVRICGSDNYYLDALGDRMSLSDEYSPRVLVYWDLKNKIDRQKVSSLAKAIYKDSFMRQNITDVWEKLGDYMMKIRTLNITIRIGNIDHLKEKIKNFKAFYQRGLIESSFKKYKEINLKYKGQVVCIKK